MNRAAALPGGNRLPSRLLFILLVSLFFLLQVWAAQRFFTSQVPGGNDFYPRWYGARALLVEGRNPYADAVTGDIERVLDPLQQRTNSFNFAFPLHVIFLFFPLVYLPYSWAQAAWMVTILWVAVGVVLVSRPLFAWRLSVAGLAGALLLTLTSYYVVRTLFLGQFTLHVTLFLAGSLLLYRRGHDGWAGALLALTSIKPQLVVLAAPWLVVWALGQRRWRFVGGLLAGGLLLLAGSLLLLPSWPLDFLDGLSDYAAVAGGRNTLAVLAGTLWPAQAAALRLLLAALLLLGMALRLWRAWGRRHDPAQAAAAQLDGLYWAILVTLLVPFQTGTTNQVLLLLLLFARAAASRRPVHLQLGGALLGSVAIWSLFFGTLRGAAESELLFLPLPFLALLLLLWPQQAGEAQGAP